MLFAWNIVLCWSVKWMIKFIPLLCPEGGATSLSKLRWLEFAYLCFWPPELEGRDGEDGKG